MEISFYTSVPKTTIIWGIQFLRYGAWQTEFLVILGYFLPFSPNQKIKIFKKWIKKKKMPGDIYHFTLVYHKSWS